LLPSDDSDGPVVCVDLVQISDAVSLRVSVNRQKAACSAALRCAARARIVPYDTEKSNAIWV